MPQEYQGPASFLHGLSDLWLRFFKDIDQLKPLYRGTEILVGQAYLDLMSAVLNISIRETPIFNREWFKLLTVREDQVSYDATADRYVFQLPDNIKDFEQLQNKIFGPTVLLEKEIDFDIDTAGTYDELHFRVNPFDWTGSGDLIPGVAFRIVSVVQDDGSEVDYRQLAFWIPEAQVDRFNLYLSYGYLIDRFEPSSESYRALLQGIMRYFMLGATHDHMASALNVMVGLPLVREDGEILQSVDRTSDDDYDLVITDKNTYSFEKGMPFREDIEDTSNWGTLTLNAFDYLTSVFTVLDHISDPTWWYNIVIPQQMLPDEARPRRILTPDLYDNLIDNPEGLVKIGDPGFFIGADEDGFIPTGRPGKRHLFSYITFERFLRHHIYSVEIDRDALNTGLVPYPRTGEDLQQVIIAGAPAYLFLYLEPDLFLEDEMLLVSGDDEVDVLVSAEFDHILGAADTALSIGLKTWKIGDYYKYASGGVLDVDNHGTTPFTPDSDDTWVVIGGNDPSRLGLLLYDSTGVSTATIIMDPDDVDRRIVTKTAADGEKFDMLDVGRFLRFNGDANYYEILEVQDGFTVVTDGGGLGVGVDFQLWQHADSEEGGGIIDWPVQIKQTIPVWIPGPSIYYWDGETRTTQYSSGTEEHFGIWMNSDELGWAVGDLAGAPKILKWDGNDWNQETHPFTAGNLYGIWSNGVDEAYACGHDSSAGEGEILRWNGSAWSLESFYTTPTDIHFTSVLGLPTTADRGAVGYYESGGTRNGVLWSRYGSVWLSYLTENNHQFLGAWGLLVTDAWTVGSTWPGVVGKIHFFDGSSLSESYDGTSDGVGILYAVHGVASERVWAVGEDGAVLRWDGTSWTLLPQLTSGVDLKGVWARDWDNLFVVGESGSNRYIYRSKDGGETWSTVHTEATASAYNAIGGIRVNG